MQVLDAFSWVYQSDRHDILTCREIARMLANDYKKRVMIVDTSNEIGGDGDIPHSGIGNARRMQVPVSDLQHKAWLKSVLYQLFC